MIRICVPGLHLAQRVEITTKLSWRNCWYYNGFGDALMSDASVPVGVFGNELLLETEPTISRFPGLEYGYGIPVRPQLMASFGLALRL